MNALPDIANYQALGALAPEPEDDGTCEWCGDQYCGPGCRPPVTGRSRSRYVERVENGDPDS